MPTPVLVSSLVGAILVMIWRMRETTRPVTPRKIVIPPLAMSTGLCMFLYEPTRIPLAWAVAALAIGAALLSYPLVKTSRLVRRGDVVFLVRSKVFILILVALVAIRLAARAYVEQYVDTLQTGALFFLLAFGMIVRWRVSMYLEYRRVVAAPEREPVALA